MIVVHCSGSRCNHRYTLERLHFWYPHASPEGGDEASHPPSSPWVSGHQDHSGSPRFARHAESLSLLRCHEASASAGFIASHEILPTCMFWQVGGISRIPESKKGLYATCSSWHIDPCPVTWKTQSLTFSVTFPRNPLQIWK